MTAAPGPGSPADTSGQGVTMDAFDYDLPDALIAQTPIEPRDSARMLIALDGGVRHGVVTDLASLVGEGDVVVVNNTKVLPARLHLRKSSGAAVEVLLLERQPDGRWHALVRPGRKLPEGTMVAGPTGLEVEIGARLDDGLRLVSLFDHGLPADDEALFRAGEAPLPPYITTPLSDPDRYQTVYAENLGSVAAPTAGLHFTPGLLAQLGHSGARIHTVDLTVGLDTFRPISVDRPQDHVMHSERYVVPESTMVACAAAQRVIVVGTTTARAMESAAATGELAGRTRLFIHGHYDFRVVDVLLTNFHMPRSSLLLLLDAFVGEHWRDLYREAIAHRYRFLSFGDCMLVDRKGRSGPRNLPGVA